MRYEVLFRLKVRTPHGIMELQAGEIITMAKDMPCPLLAQGKIKPVMPYFAPDGGHGDTLPFDFLMSIKQASTLQVRGGDSPDDIQKAAAKSEN